MASEERNALAELAERLYRVGVELCYDQLDDGSKDAVDKARRIIVELAKVPDCTFRGNPRVDKSADAVIACRAIAAEGENV